MEDAEMNCPSRQRYAKPYMWSIIAVGLAISVLSVGLLPVARIDFCFLLLALTTIGIGSRIAIQIPRISGQITVADTLIFLTLLLYDGEAAILLAAVEGVCSSLRVSKKPITILFNLGVMSLSTFFTVWMLRLCFGAIRDLPDGEYSSNLLLGVCVMALVQYIANTGLVAVAQGLKTDQPIWPTWQKYYLWSSITYLAGASAAAIIAKLINTLGVYAIIVTTPIVAIVYFTYLTYLKSVEASAAQAEQAQQHVEELSLHIAEQDRLREQFSQFEKMSAIGELASGVAHDFNNTLAGILGRAQLMMRSTNDPEKMKRGLQIIIKSAEDGAKTVKRIQDFARQRRDHDLEPVAVDQLLLDVSEITRPRWKDRAEAANIHINLELQICSDALVMGDASELREVLVNIIFNAVDAMPTGGTLTLSTEETSEGVEILISDTGTGISSEVSSRIFDPFFTTKGKAGMGLGLAVSYGIIRRHQGSIEVESEVGRGTTFRIKLPVTTEEIKAEPIAETITSTPLVLGHSVATGQPLTRAKQIKILVVDDEEPVRQLLRDILESEGYQVVVADEGRRALAVFNSIKFDAVFTDVGMPGMSGWELAREIRERNNHIPIAVITGWGEVVGSSDQKTAEVKWVITKPFTASRILEVAHEVAQGKVGAAQNGFAYSSIALSPASFAPVDPEPAVL
jgi:signal transduction histidine kinase/ActR/RegA family two-component response regulator